MAFEIKLGTKLGTGEIDAGAINLMKFAERVDIDKCGSPSPHADGVDEKSGAGERGSGLLELIEVPGDRPESMKPSGNGRRSIEPDLPVHSWESNPTRIKNTTVSINQPQEKKNEEFRRYGVSCVIYVLL
jgi:hypothetical protein